jgi:hypothetical protein
MVIQYKIKLALCTNIQKNKLRKLSKKVLALLKIIIYNFSFARSRKSKLDLGK